jgi:hypothetical protein
MEGAGDESDRSFPRHCTIHAVEDAISTTIDDEAVLLNTESGEYYGMNPVGTRIWELLEEPCDVATIEDTISGEFDVPPEECTDDIATFLSSLETEHLIEVVDDPNG